MPRWVGRGAKKEVPKKTVVFIMRYPVDRNRRKRLLLHNKNMPQKTTVFCAMWGKWGMTKLRRILLSVICTFTLVFGAAHGADTPGMSPMVNLRYVHNLIEHEWGINIPIVSEHPSAPANMRYLFAVIDAANSKVGTKTDYQHSEYATGFAANVNTSIKAVRTLIKPTYHFTATTTSDTTTFSFTISASGTFYVNWGDGTAMQKVIKPATGAQTINHTYATAGAYDIRIGGRATGYPAVNNENSSISFSNNTNLAQISGSLGRIFRNVNNNKNDWSSVPTFLGTFSNCTNLSGEIPEILFDGVPWTRVHMFNSTFRNCKKLTGNIPEKLFASIQGVPREMLFAATFQYSGVTGSIPEKLFAGIVGDTSPSTYYNTFFGCSGLTGSIPEKLFAGLHGQMRGGIFANTFRGCSGLTGEIPEKLFAGITGGLPQGFNGTFMGCSGLTGSIPENLFAGVSGAPRASAFQETFSGCSGLTGPIPENLFAGVVGAPTSKVFSGTFSGCSGLTGSIPENLFAGISGAPAVEMFRDTFFSCKNLTGEIPAGLFSGIRGAPASRMFDSTFQNCSGLTGSIPEKLFAGINGAPADTMFKYTFGECWSLDGKIPDGLFAGISGAAAPNMYAYTFVGVPLVGELPLGFLGDLSGEPVRGMFFATFHHVYNLTGLSARNPDGTPLYEVFPNATTADVDYMYSSSPGLSDYADIPAAWK